MADTKAAFEQAQKDIKALKKPPTNEDMLFLYAHYKQANGGDAKGDRPGMLDMVGRAKYDAWARLKGVKNEDAMKKYADRVAALLAKK